MARYRAAEKKDRTEKVSVTAFLFPLLSILYFELIFSYFAQTGITAYKVLFALAVDSLALAVSRITPWRFFNFILQSVWILLCGGLIAAQFLCRAASGGYFSLFAPDTLPSFGALLSAALGNIPFLACMLVPLVLQFTAQRAALLKRRSLPGRLLGANWLEPVGAILLAVVLAFVSVTIAFYDTEGEASPRRQMEIELLPAASVSSFGVLPETALDFKYNVLHIAQDEIIHRYVVTEDGRRIELPEE